MNDNKKFLGWFTLLNDLGNTQPTRFSNVIKIIGSSAASVVAVVLVLFQGQMVESSSWQSNAVALAFMLVILSVFILAVRHLAISTSGNVSLKSVALVFLRIFLYMSAIGIPLLIFIAAVVYFSTRT